MRQIYLCALILMLSGSVFAQDKAKMGPQMDLFKRESTALRGAIDDVMNAVLGRGVLDPAKATYLEGYGAVITLEVSLEPTRSPFTSPRSPAEIRTVVSQRRQAITEKLEGLLKERAGTMQSIGSTEAVTIVLYLLNANPADVPDLPSQILFTARKQDTSQITRREF
jgi:hypothetical protein